VQVRPGGEVPGVVAEQPADCLLRYAAAEHDRRARMPQRVEPHRRLDPCSTHALPRERLTRRGA
jgi:hypothetical protein